MNSACLRCGACTEDRFEYFRTASGHTTSYVMCDRCSAKLANSIDKLVTEAFRKFQHSKKRTED